METVDKHLLGSSLTMEVLLWDFDETQHSAPAQPCIDYTRNTYVF